jgi:hypothetical protein
MLAVTVRMNKYTQSSGIRRRRQTLQHSPTLLECMLEASLIPSNPADQVATLTNVRPDVA